MRCWLLDQSWCLPLNQSFPQPINMQEFHGVGTQFFGNIFCERPTELQKIHKPACASHSQTQKYQFATEIKTIYINYPNQKNTLCPSENILEIITKLINNRYQSYLPFKWSLTITSVLLYASPCHSRACLNKSKPECVKDLKSNAYFPWNLNIYKEINLSIPPAWISN